MKNLKKLTILHSNDLHGDFLAEEIDSELVGGVSMLSGYVVKVRNEEKNTLYCIAGDMFRGSVIDSEFKGISTIEIMNMLSPDVVTLGNHETDYGIAHLLFIKKYAKFPIINANLHIKTNGARIFKPHYIAVIDEMKILFIGIITEDVISQTKNDGIIGSFVDINEAAQEIGKICDTYNAIDIDFNGEPIEDSRIYKIGLQKYHYINFEEFFNVPFDEISSNGTPVVISTSCCSVFDEYLSNHKNLDREVTGRLVINKKAVTH